MSGVIFTHLDVRGHFYSLESSKIDLYFVGGQVRSDHRLI